MMTLPFPNHHQMVKRFLFCLFVLSAPTNLALAGKTLTEKTLVVWVAPANLDQQGGSALTIEKSAGVFDAIVFGELAKAKWMAGSNSFSRTERQQQAWPTETADSQTFVQVAIVYHGREITIYRDGRKYAQYRTEGLATFGADSFAVMGLRHLDAGPENRYFLGAIDDARIYDSALDSRTIAELKPNKPSSPTPLAWWDFEQGSAIDRIGEFPVSTLVGNARVTDGKLVLKSSGAYLIALRKLNKPTSDSKNADRVARALRERLIEDPYRPGYHFVTPEGRCMPFDPNGAIYWKGRYHLFYIFQDHRGHNWGHVSSTDLFHWRHHPTRLTSGMFSGNCFLNKDGRPTICYHQVGQGNAMAVALDDELNDWKKLESNPITPVTRKDDPHKGKYRSWDPYGWLEGDTYYAIFGGTRPAIAKSSSLEGPWNYVGDLMANPVDGVAIDEDVSCADFFKLGDKYMLLCISHRLGCRYYLGDWKDEQFHPTSHAKMSWVDHSFFAPESLLDDRGRRIMWSWIFDEPNFKTRTDHGWSGTMSLPRVLSLGGDGRLRITVPREIERLRYHPRQKLNVTLQADSEQTLENIQGNSLELAIEVTADNARQFGVKVCCSPDGSEQTVVYYDAVEKKLKIDTRASSSASGPKTVEAGPLALAEHEPLKLRVFVDKSVVEVFANRRQAVMRRIYPSQRASVEVRLFSRGGPADFRRIDAWDMMPSNPY